MLNKETRGLSHELRKRIKKNLRKKKLILIREGRDKNEEKIKELNFIIGKM